MRARVLAVAGLLALTAGAAPALAFEPTVSDSCPKGSVTDAETGQCVPELSDKRKKAKRSPLK